MIWGGVVSGGGGATAGNGLTLTGSVFSIDTSITADLSTNQTFTNKTLTSPKITGLGVGDLLLGGAANVVSSLASVASGQVLTSAGAGVAPAWSGTPTLAAMTLTQIAASSGAPTLLSLTGAAHTNLTASTEVIGVRFNFAQTKQHATGALATQREVVFDAPTYSFVGLSTITNTATVAITGAPIAGTNATLSNTYALWVQSGKVQIDGSISCGSASTLIEKFGNGASANNFGTALGGSANATAGGVGAALAVGAGTSATFARSMAFGVGATTTADGQIVFCVNDTAITSSVFFGNNTVNATPVGTSVNATGGSGANVAGAAFGVNGGRGTGSGAGGPVTVSTSKAGGAGSALNGLVERLRVDPSGNFNFNTTVAGTTAERVLALGNASVVAPTASADLVQFYAVDLSAGNCTLGLFTERAVAVDVGVASSHSLSVVINGTTYRLLLAV